MNQLPMDESQRAAARVALAFQSYAVTRRAAADELGTDNAELRAFLADQFQRARATDNTGTTSSPTAPQLGCSRRRRVWASSCLSTDLSPDAAVAALQAQLDLTFGT